MYTMLERFVRRFQKPREKRERIYRRYLAGCSSQISRGNLGRKIPRAEVRDMGLAIRNFNRNEDKVGSSCMDTPIRNGF